MHVCVATNLHPPLDDRIYYKEVLSLAKRFDLVTLVAPDCPVPEGTLPQSVRYIPLKSSGRWLGRIRSILEIVRLVARYRPDVVHFHDFDLALAVPMLRAVSRAKLVYDVHEAYPEAVLISSLPVPYLLRRPLSWCVDRLEKTMAHWCELIVTADEPTAAAFARTGRPVIVVFNYPPKSLFQTAVVSDALRERFSGRKVIVYHGSMSADRGLFHMIRAMPTLRRADSAITLLLIGLRKDGLRQAAEREIRELGVASNVEVIPWLEYTSIPSCLRVARLGLVPLQPTEKYMRNIPIKVFEYMACGLPVLGADLPPIARYIEESGAGRVYDSTSVESLAANVLDMLANEAELARMSKNGLRAVRERWNWGRMEERLFEAYDGLDAQIRQRRTGSGRGQARSVPSR